MPELPEVETVVRFLQPHILGKTISRVEFPWPKTCAGLSIAQFRKNVVGCKIRTVERRGKYIVFTIGSAWFTVHLRMTGHLFPAQVGFDRNHVTFFSQLDGGHYLVFRDQRKFGRVTWVNSLKHLDEKLGPEPFSDVFTQHWLLHQFKSRKRQIKALLLDQAFIAGLGNIYVDEVLWFARIHPLRVCNRLSAKKVKLLHGAIRLILREAISARGTTIRDFRVDGEQPGGYKNHLKIFNRSGYPCYRCEKSIIKTRAAGRGTYICPRCQRK
ncbi:uncharacterized protein METZ01_LOCUS165627 [marine metagenome]|jgi:formamidopyrimidine-DNA glycosylase|uniref:Formamidopyrimidine-DNA glycosylase catalytic domain-containing protein n=1 Tax=marine metagenome TaxID=408172 RepID=A0A382BHV0_9ZZZZ